jgi:3-methyladenine DNA glycosylase/8-oxoguanine DNA glycosylase
MSTGKELDIEATRMIARVSSRSQSRAGDTIKVALDMSRIHFFDKDSERRIGIPAPKKKAAEVEAEEENEADYYNEEDENLEYEYNDEYDDDLR